MHDSFIQYSRYCLYLEYFGYGYSRYCLHSEFFGVRYSGILLYSEYCGVRYLKYFPYLKYLGIPHCSYFEYSGVFGHFVRRKLQYSSRVFQGFIFRGTSSTRNISGFYTPRYSGFEFHSEYFTRMMNHSSVQCPRYP